MSCKGVTLATDRNSLRAILREKFPRNHGQLLPALHFLQHEFGYLPDWAMEVIGWHLGIPSSEVYGAATSYTEAEGRKAGQHDCPRMHCSILSRIRLPRHSHRTRNGLGARLWKHLRQRRVHPGRDSVRFLCAMAPAMEVNGRWHGRVDSQSAIRLAREAANE